MLNQQIQRLDEQYRYTIQNILILYIDEEVKIWL